MTVCSQVLSLSKLAIAFELLRRAIIRTVGRARALLTRERIVSGVPLTLSAGGARLARECTRCLRIRVSVCVVELLLRLIVRQRRWRRVARSVRWARVRVSVSVKLWTGRDGEEEVVRDIISVVATARVRTCAV